jgi:hypothetical protein
MLPLSTHLFSNWSKPLNNDGFLYSLEATLPLLTELLTFTIWKVSLQNADSLNFYLRWGSRSSSGDLYPSGEAAGPPPRTMSSTVASGPNLSFCTSWPGQTLTCSASTTFSRSSIDPCQIVEYFRTVLGIRIRRFWASRILIH